MFLCCTVLKFYVYTICPRKDISSFDILFLTIYVLFMILIPNKQEKQLVSLFHKAHVLTML